MTLKFLSVLCIVGAIGLFGYEYISPKKINYKVKKNVNSDDKINYRLQSVDQKIKMQKLKALQAQDHETISGTITEDERNYKVKMIKGIDDRLDSTLQDVISDLTPSNRSNGLKKLENEIQEGVDELEDLQDYNESERDAYIKSFLENAKARGLNIKIDKDLNVYEN